MKRVILVGDGMGDYPLESLGGRTVLQASLMPHVRRIAAAGRVLQVITVPGTLEPGSDVANLSLLGYDPEDGYTGRAPIEAAGAGIVLRPEDVAIRCNLVTVSEGRLLDYSAGHIPTAEAVELIGAVAEGLGRNGLRFHAGVSYRHLAVWPRGPAAWTATPPHEIIGKPVSDALPVGPEAGPIRELMAASERLLADHPVNRRRRSEGKAAATQIWLWGHGRSLRLRTFPETYGMGGGVVSAVDLVRGLGVLAGLSAPRIPGATGFLDTDYAAKVHAALGMLRDGDFAYLHVEAPDECGHMGDVALKVRACEAFDSEIVGPVWRALEESGEPYRLVVTTDHRTPCAIRGHTREPVPLARLDGPVGETRAEADFDEFSGEPPRPAFEVIRRVLVD